MAYDLVWEPKGLLVTYRGHLSSTEIAVAARTYQGDARYDTLRYILHDCEACSGASYSTNEILELAATDGVASLVNPSTRVAIVATHPQVVALAEHYRSMGMNQHEVRLFSDIEEARQWAMASFSKNCVIQRRAPP